MEKKEWKVAFNFWYWTKPLGTLRNVFNYVIVTNVGEPATKMSITKRFQNRSTEFGHSF